MGKSGVITVPSPVPDGVGTVCFKLTVPDTPDWRNLIDSILSLLYRGRAYKDKQGDELLQALDEGWKVYNSLEEVSCDIGGGETPLPEVTEVIKYIVRNMDKGDCIMGCCRCDKVGDISSNTPQTQENLLPENFIPPTQQATIPPVDINWDSWKCKSAKYIVDAFALSVQGIANLAEVASLNTSTAQDTFFLTVGSIKPVEIYVEILEWLLLAVDYAIRWLSPSVASGIIAYVELKRENLVDAIYCAEDAQEASDNWFAILISESTLSIAQKAVVWAFLQMVDFSAHWQTSTQRMLAPAYDNIINNYASDCTCATDGGEAGLPMGYALVPMIPDGAPVSINGASLSQAGEFYEIMGQGNAFMDIVVAEPIYNMAVVPLAQVVGFYFELDSANIVNGNSVSQRLVNASTQFTDINFGGGANTFLAEEVFAGAVASEAPLQTWLGDNAFRWEDNTAETNTLKRAMSWGIWDGSTGSGLVNEFIVKCYWIINTTGL